MALTSRRCPDRYQLVSTISPRSSHRFLASYPQGYQQPMKVRPEELERFATQLIKSYGDKELIVTQSDDRVLKSKIVDIIAKNFAEEEAIEEEARKILAAHTRGARDLDSYKMFLLAKQKLAAKRGFIL